MGSLVDDDRIAFPLPVLEGEAAGETGQFLVFLRAASGFLRLRRSSTSREQAFQRVQRGFRGAADAFTHARRDLPEFLAN